jgi:hypothetical protein
MSKNKLALPRAFEPSRSRRRFQELFLAIGNTAVAEDAEGINVSAAWADTPTLAS